MNKLKNVVEKFFLLSFFLFSAVELIGEDNFANTENANIDIIYSQDYLKEGDELILGLRFKLTPDGIYIGKIQAIPAFHLS